MIRAAEIRVIADDGEQLGVMTPEAAIARAEEVGLDLVEVSPAARPPVCRIMDYGRYKYEQKKKANKSKGHAASLKEGAAPAQNGQSSARLPQSAAG